MGWKVIVIDDTGSASVYGGNDTKQIMQYLSGTNVAVSDSSNKVNVNTDTSFASGKFRIKGTSGFSYIFDGSAIAADRHIILPNMGSDGTISLTAANVANDWGNNMQTFRNMFFRWANPTNASFYTVRTEGITANRTVRLPQLSTDDDFVFANAVQTLANKTIVNPSLSLLTINTDANTIKHSATNNSGDILANTGVKYDRFARGTANQFLATNPTGTGIQWRDISSISGGGGGGGGSGTGDFQFPLVGNTMSGAWYGTGISGTNGTGCLTGFITNMANITAANIQDTSGRIGLHYDFLNDDERAGWRTNDEFVCRIADPELWVRYKMLLNGQNDNYRMCIGFVSDVNGDYTTDDALNSKHAFTWFKETADTNIQIGLNDGDAAQNKDPAVSLSSTNESIHTIRLFADSTNNRWSASLDGATAQNFTTEIPAATQRMGLMVLIENEDASDRSCEIYGAYFKCKVLA